MLKGKLRGTSTLRGSIQRESLGTGTTDYPKLNNLPQINGVELVGNKTSEELGLVSVDYVDKKVADLVNSAPETLDTLGEVAKAIQENADVVDALNSAIGNKADKGEVTALDARVTDLENAEAPEVDLTPIEESISDLDTRIKTWEDEKGYFKIVKGSYIKFPYVTTDSQVVINEDGSITIKNGGEIKYQPAMGTGYQQTINGIVLKSALEKITNNLTNRINSLENAGGGGIDLIRVPKEV